jgi:hypothetical protein
MNKRAHLAAALQTATRGGEAAPAARAPIATVTPIGARTPSRIGKKTVAAHFDPAVSKQLKQIGLEADRSMQDLLREAINDLFQKYGKGPIA